MIRWSWDSLIFIINRNPIMVRVSLYWDHRCYSRFFTLYTVRNYVSQWSCLFYIYILSIYIDFPKGRICSVDSYLIAWPNIIVYNTGIWQQLKISLTLSVPCRKMARGWLNIKMPSYEYRKSHCGDKMILQLSYLHNGVFHILARCYLYIEPIEAQGAVSIRKTVLPGMAIPMLKIRRSNSRLIFNMEIAIHR